MNPDRRPRGASERLLAAACAAATLVAVIVAAFALVVLALGRAPDAGERTVLALSALAAAAVALTFPFARRRVADAARRLLRAQSPPLDAPLRLLTNRLSRAIPLDELLLQTAETLRRTFALRAAEIWTGSAGELRRTVSDPEREPARLSLGAEQPIVAREGVAGEGFARLWLAPLLEGREDAVVRIAPAVRAGEVLGLIVAERAAGSQPFSDREDEVLAALGHQVGLALHNARLDSALQASLEELERRAEELRASRARIVASADAERRRIERDLHDGTQQRLVAVMARLGEARRLLAAGEQRAQATLAEATAELEGTVDELREVAHGIYPPLLSDSGLAEALAAAASRVPLKCHVIARGVTRHPREVESALYFCCLEAVQNAVKHAGRGAEVSIRLVQEDARLTFAVEDDGAGFDPAQRRPGMGLTNMGDRLGAVGGRLQVESAPRQGTRVIGTVPLLAQPAASER